MTYISGIGIKKYQIIQFHLYQFSKLRAYKYKRQIFYTKWSTIIFDRSIN